MLLFVYQPSDWLKVLKLLDIEIVAFCKKVGINRRTFYHCVKKNNANIEMVLDFTAVGLWQKKP